MVEITKEAIIRAIQKIDENSELRKGRESYIYDLEYEGKNYPPILVISEACKFLGKPEVTIRDFNNSALKAFKLLTNHGFSVNSKSSNSTNVWFVYQGSTYKDNRGKKFLWAPEFNKSGGSQFYWKNMLKVKKGDIIFNYSKGIRAISIAENDCYRAPNPDNISNWQQEGYKVDIRIHELGRIITIDELKKRNIEIANSLKEISNKPFNDKGGPNQGYLYEFSKEAGRIIRDVFGEPFGSEPIDEFFGEFIPKNIIMQQPKQFINGQFNSALKESGLLFSKLLLLQYISSLLTKPFVILTGLSGSGKTKLAHVFAKWICENESQYKLIPVGADWTNREPLLGYPNALESGKYVSPENGVLAMIIEAMVDKDKPYFLILDEMNLSHVERYFADFLSAMESGEDIPLHPESVDWKDNIPAKIKLPKNLFIIGTVNIDETTYMFSPKVLDRANVIEFRVSETEMEKFLDNIKPMNLDSINGLGTNLDASFVELANNRDLKPADTEILNKTLKNFFKELKKTGAEFGYRSASEIHRFVAVANQLDPDWKMDRIIDCAIMQKLLPKVHGSRRKLESVLKTLGSLCLADGKFIEEIFNRKSDIDFNDPSLAKYPLSLEKIDRMYKGLTDNGFTSYAEA